MNECSIGANSRVFRDLHKLAGPFPNIYLNIPAVIRRIFLSSPDQACDIYSER